MPPLSPLQSRMNGALLVLFVLSSLIIVLAGVVPERDLRDTTIGRAEDELGNLARLVGQHAEDTVQIADNVLIGFRQILETPASAPHARDLIDNMLTGADARPRLRHIAVVDASGTWIAGSRPPPAASADSAAQPHVGAHRASPDRGLRIGAPERDPATGHWMIPLTRRFDTPDGRFAGVISASISVAYFLDFYRSALVRGDKAVALFLNDGTLLARLPEIEGAAGTTFPLPPLAPTASTPASTTTAPPIVLSRMVSPIDGQARTAAIRRGVRLPLVVMVSQADADILADWWPQAVRRTATRFVVASLFFGLGLFVVAQIRRRQRMANALLRRESEFRVLAEGSGDAVLRLEPDGRIAYASPVSASVIGAAADGLVGQTLADLVRPDDRPAVAAALRDAGMGATARVGFFIAGDDGAARRLAATLRAAGDGDGNDKGIVAVLRDETQVYLDGRRLASLAATDALTGLANRRTFAERLEREWRRAARDGKPLSLLFIDADRFKPFNDRYGHLAGDHCLERLAAVIAATVRRPGDLVARYGGEEFVLLLPGTDDVGARRIAEAVRVAVVALAIPHADNEPYGIVTASIGVATDRAPRPDGTPEALIAGADRALYAAKAAGRNCFRVDAEDALAFDVAWQAPEPPATPAPERPRAVNG